MMSGFVRLCAEMVVRLSVRLYAVPLPRRVSFPDTPIFPESRDTLYPLPLKGVPPTSNLGELSGEFSFLGVSK